MHGLTLGLSLSFEDRWCGRCSAWLALAQRAPVGHVGVETEYGHDNDNDIGNAGAISNGNDNDDDDTKAASNVMIMLNRVHVQILVC